MADGELITVAIRDVDCSANKGRSKIYYLHNDKVHSAVLAYPKCTGLKEGDQATLYYSRKHDWYLYKDDGLGDEDWGGMLASGTCMVLLAGNWIYSWRERKRQGAAKKRY